MDISLHDLTKDELIAIIETKHEEEKQLAEYELRTKKMLADWDGIDLETLTDEQKLEYCYAVKRVQQVKDIKAEQKKRHRPAVASKPRLVKKPPTINGQRYDSHYEARLANGPFARFEPCRTKVAYVEEKQWEVDGWIPFTNIAIDYKPVLEGPNTLRKFRQLCIQSKIAILLVFKERDIPLYWQAPRKDGSIITQEEWCERQQRAGLPIYYTFEDESEEFLESDYWRRVVELHSTFDYEWSIGEKVTKQSIRNLRR